jgi:hypothetical protein
MMPHEPILDIMRRTMENLAFIDEHASDQGPFEVTQLINSFLGALAHPWQDLGAELNLISLAEAESQCWPIPQNEQTAGQTPTSLGDLIRFLRNGIAHGHIIFLPDGIGRIGALRIENRYKGRTTWAVTVTLETMRRFLHRFVALIEDIDYKTRNPDTSTVGRRAFNRYIGIDYSGAQTPTASLKGLRVYLAEGDPPPAEVPPPPSPRKYWTRKGIAEWLVERLSEDIPTLVGIDHGFSFPLRYFEIHGLARNWPAFLDDFQRHWPTDEDNTYVDFVRDGSAGNGAARAGNTRWRRLTEERAGGAKSVFHFDVPGSVAKSTHSGIPWLRFIRRKLGSRVHFWPFDGWDIPAGRSAIAEVYPALWSHSFAPEDRTADQHDAYAIAARLSQADREGTLAAFLRPGLTPPEAAVAQVEGWILGVPGSGLPGKRKPVARKTTQSRVSALSKGTTTPGFKNANGQIVLRRTTEPGNDHNQKVYVLRCDECSHEYGANGSDIWQRRCPSCQGGAKGLPY